MTLHSRSERRLLLVSQRPQEYGGAGSARWSSFGRRLPEHGWEVDVVTARPNPTGGEYSPDPVHQRLYRARRTVTGTAGAILRPLSRRLGVQPEALAPSALWTLTGRRAVREALARHRPDAVVATSPPVAGHAVVAGLAREIGVPIVLDVRDTWAGNPYYDAGGRALARLERRILEPAAAIVCVTDAMAERLLGLHPHIAGRLHVLPNGFDPAVLEERREREPATGGPVTLVHAGPLHGYPGRTLEPVLQAVRRPELRDRVRVELIGAGAKPETAGVDLVTRPAMPWREAVAAQARAGVGVVLYSSDPTVQGTKVFELLALGRPVLALVDEGNATHALLRDLGQDAGCARHDDVDAIAAALGRLLDAPPPPVPRERLAPYDRSAIAARMAALLDSLVG